MRINRRRTVPLAVLAAVLLSQSTVGSAIAAEIPVVVQFTTNPTKTLEYGEFWSFDFSCDPDFYSIIYEGGLATATVSGAPAGYAPQLSMYPNVTFQGTVYAPYDAAPLPVGTYSVTVEGSYDDGTDTYTGKTTPPATLTVEKAKLGMELRVIADPTNADSAIVTARFTGRFVDEYQSTFFAGAAKSPEGTWHIIITDEKGDIATERNVERTAGDDVLATSFYWEDAEPGEKYTASANFVPSGTSGSNFSVTSATDFSYTAAESQRPVPTSTATGQPDTSLPEATGFGLPLWAVILISVLAVGLGTLVTILSVRLNRRSAATTAEVSS